MLKYLNDRVESAVAEEERGEVTASALAGIGRTTPTSLCGFEMSAEMVCTDTLMRDRKDRLARITMYRDDAARLRTALGSIGVIPLAIITEKAFSALVREMGLFTMQPSERGSVIVDNSHIVAMRNPPNLLFVSFVALSLAAAVLAFWGCTTFDFDWNATPWPFVGAAFVFFVTLGVGLGIGGLVDDRVRRHGFKKRAAAYLHSTSWEQMLVDLSHEGKRNFYQPNWDSDTRTPTIRQVVLPPAPSDIIDVVCRLSRAHAAKSRNEYRDHFGLRIAAEADAIAFKDGVRGLFDLDAIEAQIERERQIKADPILYVVSGSAVAIVGQYGDLPAELAVVDGIVNSEHLL